MAARVDFARYPNASAKLVNLLPIEQGGLIRRPGTRFVKEVKNSADADHRLIPFVFNAEQAYVLELGDLYMRFYTDQGRLENPPGTPIEIVTPWTAAQIGKVRFAQRADIMTLVHPDVAPYRLSRVDNFTWTLVRIEYRDGPWLDENLTATTIIPSGITGSITLTASAPLWQAAHVGALWRIGRRSGVVNLPEWVASTAVTAGDVQKYDGINGINVYRAVQTGTTGEIPPEHQDGIREDGSIDWEYLYTDIFGWVEITGFTSSTVVDADVKGVELPSFGGGGTTFWQEGAWSDVQGYPHVVGFYEQRAVYATTASQPQTVWLSKSRELDNFQVRTNSPDDDPVDRTIDSENPTFFRWMVTASQLVLGGSEDIWGVRSSNLDQPITPTNIQAKRLNREGSADVTPAAINEAVLFVERNGRRLNELLFNFDTDGFIATDLSVLNETILKPACLELAWQRRAWRTVWGRKSDGRLATFIYNRQQEVLGWAGQEIGGDNGDGFGKVIAITTIPGSAATNSGERDELWMVVERVIDSSTVRYVEFLEGDFESDTAQEDAFFVDSGATFSGAATNVITGLEHLEGETVKVLGDGSVHPDVVVTGGQVTLERDVTKAQIGLASPYVMQTLKLEIPTQQGTSIGKRKRAARVLLVLDRTINASIGPDENNQEVVPTYTEGSAMDAPRALLTGEFLVDIDGEWERDPRLAMVGEDPGPFALLAYRLDMIGPEV
ncbi:MAG: hypothetical protein ACR2QF_03000 [Geminicoccaceae bacterium]